VERCCKELEQSLERIVTLPECCQEDCKQPRPCCNPTQHSGRLNIVEGVEIDSKPRCG
jgi:hypothetical protein